jgi:hypothetical protein
MMDGVCKAKFVGGPKGAAENWTAAEADAHCVGIVRGFYATTGTVAGEAGSYALPPSTGEPYVVASIFVCGVISSWRRPGVDPQYVTRHSRCLQS